MKDLATLKAQLLANPDTAREYAAQQEEFTLARELIAARAAAGLTQAAIAQRMGTTQATIARLESGKRPPNLQTLQRYAAALGLRAVVKLEPASATA